MLNEKPYDLCFGTLADDLRLKIMNYLSSNSMTVKQLSELTGAERSTVSHSIKMLKTCKHVTSEKKGKNIMYSVNPSGLFGIRKSESLISMIDSHIDHNCEVCEKMKIK